MFAMSNLFDVGWKRLNEFISYASRDLPLPKAWLFLFLLTMEKTIVKKISPTFKIGTNDIKVEFNTDSKSVLNKTMKFFGLTYKDSDHLHLYRDGNKTDFEIFMTKDECLAFAETYGHERKRIITSLVAKLEMKYKQSANGIVLLEYDKKEALNAIVSIQRKIEELSTELKKQLERLNS